MKAKKILSTFRQAVEKYNMIQPSDKIAVGLSGGKDSLMLLFCLSIYKKIRNNDFDIVAIHIDMFDGKTDTQKLQEFANQIGVELFVKNTSINRIVFDERKEKNPCSLCAKMRRGALIDCAKNLNCNKLALGHNADDLVETFFLSMFYEGRLSTFAPVTQLDKSQITIIRPLILTEERNIVYATKDLPILKNKCLANKNTQRETIKQMIHNIKKDIPTTRKLILSAIIHPERYNLFDEDIKRFDK